VKNAPYIELKDNNIPNFWLDSSKFLCSANMTIFSAITESFSNDFALPESVKEVRVYESFFISTFQI
jgi:hypothetical protein